MERFHIGECIDEADLGYADEQKRSNEIQHVKELIDEMRSQNMVEALSSGFRFVSKELGGYHAGELMTICGVENSGKTAFVVSEAERLAVDLHVPTLIGLGVMGARQFLSLMVAYACNVRTKNLWELMNDPIVQDKTHDYVEKLEKAPLYVLRPLREANWEEEIRKFIEKNKIRILFFDDLEFTFWENAQQKMRQIASDLDISIVTTQTVTENRDEDGYIRNIWLADLRNSMAETVVAFNDFEYSHIYCDERGNDLRGKLRVEILKQKGLTEKKDFLVSKSWLFMKDTCGMFPDEPYPQYPASLGGEHAAFWSSEQMKA